MNADVAQIAKRLLLEIAETKYLTLFEPEKQKFFGRLALARQVQRSIEQASHDDVVLFQRPCGRDTFLWASAMNLLRQDTEWLIAGLGKRLGEDRRRPTKVTGFWIGKGTRSSVSFTPLARDLIEKQTRVNNGEVILVHNHPRSPLSAMVKYLVGWTPLPSRQDRGTALGLQLSSIKSSFSENRHFYFRIYLVEDGRLREFFMPSIGDTISLIEAIAKKLS